jgi:DNA-binding transcriptional LysR family regulator
MNGYAFSTKFNRFMDYIYNTSPGIKILAKFLEQDRTERALIGSAAKLDSGEFDLILDQHNVHYQNFDVEKLKVDEWVVVTAQSNSFNDEISKDDFLKAKHIVCTTGGDDCYRGTKKTKLDVALEVPSYTNVIETVAQTQYIATIPKEVALSYVKRLKINVYKCPFETNSLELFMYSSKEPALSR